jgi:hypothetical protein
MSLAERIYQVELRHVGARAGIRYRETASRSPPGTLKSRLEKVV